MKLCELCKAKARAKEATEWRHGCENCKSTERLRRKEATVARDKAKHLAKRKKTVDIRDVKAYGTSSGGAFTRQDILQARGYGQDS